jgi:aconitate hydratase
MNQALDSDDFIESYRKIYQGDDKWNELIVPQSANYEWNDESTYLKEAPFFRDISAEPDETGDIRSARALLKLGDSINTDHISPAGNIAEDSPAGRYLKGLGIQKEDFNSYGSRRGNHEVMVRGTFANVRLKNELASREGGYTKYFPGNEVLSVFDAATRYMEDNTPLIILAGADYGSGSSRDWAAKGTSLLGIKAIIAESYERIHRSNLVGMGVLPLQYKTGESALLLGLKGDEKFDISISENLFPRKTVKIVASAPDGNKKEFEVIVRLDSETEITYYKNDGILQYVLRSFLRNEYASVV